MKALTIRQPYASLIALGVKHIETRLWRAPQSLIGQTIAIHAGAHRPPEGEHGRFAVRTLGAVGMHDTTNGHTWAPLPLGAVVATATLADCLPMIDHDECAAAVTEPYPAHVCLWHNGRARAITSSDLGVDITDQLPYGDFTPGRWAWMLTNVQPTTERCPNDCTRFDGNVPGWTRGSSWDWVPCGVCDGAMKCEPIPAKGKQGLWTWQP